MVGAYVAYCVVVAVISRFRLMPSSWQVHFLEDAIIRQLVPLLGFFIVAWASKAYFRRRFASGEVFVGAPLILTLSFVIAPVVMFQQGVGFQGDYSFGAVFGLQGSPINNVLIGMFFVFAGIFLTKDWRRVAGIILIIGIALTSQFIQFKLLVLVVLAILIGVSARAVIIGMVAVLVVVYGIGMHFIPDVMRIDPNSGLRLSLVSDVLSSMRDTYGIGIGYGKESVRWVYRVPGMPDFTFLPDPETMTHARMLEALSTGAENSLAQGLLRAGVPGFLLLLAAFIAAFPRRNLAPDIRKHAAAVFAMMLLGCLLNSALESPLAAVGHGFLYGYLIALRAGTRFRTAWTINPVIARPVLRPQPS